MNNEIYVSELLIQNQNYIMATTDLGLCYVDIARNQEQAWEQFRQWSNRWAPHSSIQLAEEDHAAPYITQLNEYWNKQRIEFTVPFHLLGTEFQTAVWQALLTIPYAQTVSYQHIAQLLNKPSAVRAVGGAIGKNPLLIFVPCHRVIGKNGSLTGFSSGIEMKVKLLEHEGIK